MPTVERWLPVLTDQIDNQRHKHSPSCRITVPRVVQCCIARTSQAKRAPSPSAESHERNCIIARSRSVPFFNRQQLYCGLPVVLEHGATTGLTKRLPHNHNWIRTSFNNCCVHSYDGILTFWRRLHESTDWNILVGLYSRRN